MNRIFFISANFLARFGPKWARIGPEIGFFANFPPSSGLNFFMSILQKCANFGKTQRHRVLGIVK